MTDSRLYEDSGVKAEGLSREATNGNAINSNSLKSFQPTSTSSAWQKVGQGSGNASLKVPKATKALPVHHFGLLDVPAPEALFNAPHLPASWRGASHAPVSIPEASDLISPLNANAHSQSQQLIRPKASRKPGDSRSHQHLSHHAALPRAGVGATNMEGSATSDDLENSNSRLIPKRGQGPGLRSEGGGKIDEYLMRLLRAGGPPSEPSDKKNSDGAGHRNVSRLGPLAGTGVMASSMQRSGSGKARSKERQGIANGEKRRHELVDTATEPKTEPNTRLTQTQPSIAGAQTDEANQASQSVHPVKRRASMDLTTARGHRPAVNGLSGPHQPVAGLIGRSNGGAGSPPLSLSSKLKRQLGPGQWAQIRTSLGYQIQQFQQQVVELHRLKDMQARLLATSPATRPSPANHQDGSLSSSRPSWLNGASSMAAPSWMPDMERFGSNAEAFSWPAFQAVQARANLQDSTKQRSEPVKVLSQTTRLALDAQRMRRKLRDQQGQQSHPDKAPAIGNQVSSGQGTIDSVKRPAASLAHPQAHQAAGAQNNLNMWLSMMQQQQQSQALQSEAVKSLGNTGHAPAGNQTASGPFFVNVEQLQPFMYRATSIDLPGVSAHGRTEDHATAMFKDAVMERLTKDRHFRLPANPTSHANAQAALHRSHGLKPDPDKSRAILRVVSFE